MAAARVGASDRDHRTCDRDLVRSAYAAASRLAMRDCGIGIGDFGRGATSFERLTDLPLNELKIDKTVFWQCVAGEIPVAMLEEVIRYCGDHGIMSVIEGIETTDHRDRAIATGADAGQGFLWDRPAFDPLSANGALRSAANAGIAHSAR